MSTMASFFIYAIIEDDVDQDQLTKFLNEMEDVINRNSMSFPYGVDESDVTQEPA